MYVNSNFEKNCENAGNSNIKCNGFKVNGVLKK
jgi:hypothetical protein